MFNPVFPDFRKLKDNEIENKMLELNKKYWIAAGMGQGQAADQIILALNILREEQQRRQSELLKKAAKNSGEDLDGLINID